MAETTDEACVQQAYQEEIKQHVNDYVANLIDGTPDAEGKFCAGPRLSEMPAPKRSTWWPSALPEPARLVLSSNIPLCLDFNATTPTPI